MAGNSLYYRVKSLPFAGFVAWYVYRAYWALRTYADLKKKIPLPSTPFLNTRAYEEPSLETITSQLCTTGQCVESKYQYWCSEMRSPARLGRKQWEFVFILEALNEAGCFVSGKKGLGFGCGKEPLAAVMAKHGCKVICTDLSTDQAFEQGWVETNQHSEGFANMQYGGICDKNLFFDRVSFRFSDMNDISPELKDFDFVWSACAFEHLGSLRHGMDFVLNAMDCLAPGGVAVHTTEFNLTSNDDTFETESCAIYRQQDIERLVMELESKGFEVWPLNLNPGSHKVDDHVDWPPYHPSIHLKLMLENYVVTSIGIIVRKPLG
jgi:2-polyprenyl-3-methyl-5-hydroxy-6-metoxy-1,4-benzoquinol methylase